jgi:hypothetical protein
MSLLLGLFQQAQCKTYQRDEEEYYQYDGDPLEESRFDLGLGKFIATDGAAHALLGYLRRTIGTLFSLGSDQIPTLPP